MFWIRFAIHSCMRRRHKTGILLAGITVAVATLVVLGAIMVGVNDTMVRNAVALKSGHVSVSGAPKPMELALERLEYWEKELEHDDDVKAALSRCLVQALVEGNQNTGAMVLCFVEPQKEAACTPIDSHIVQGTYLAHDRGLIIGDDAATDLGVSVGDEVKLTTSSQSYARQVTGIYDTGISDYDRSMAFLPISEATSFQEPQVTAETAVFLRSKRDPNAFVRDFRNTVQKDETMETWEDTIPEVAQLVDLNRFSMNLMTLMVIIILGFGVSNALLISVMDRYRQFAVLKAIGARPREIVVMILSEALTLCLGAGCLGTLIGVAGVYLWSRSGLDLSHYTSSNPHFSADPIVYPRATVWMVLTPQALALSAAVLSALWPAIIAARRSVSRGMRDL